MKNWGRNGVGAVVGLVGALVAALALVGAAAADHDPNYEGTADSHVVVAGNPGCPTGTSLAKVDPPADGTYGDGAVVLDVSEDGKSASWQFTAAGAEKWDMAAVIVKGGDAAAIYIYDSAGAGLDDSDSGLTAPLNNGDQRPVISHVEFCVDVKDAASKPNLTVAKTADPTWTLQRGGWNVTKTGELLKAPSASGNGEIGWNVAWTKGAEVNEYRVAGTITIENTGSGAAIAVSVDDSLDGDSDFVLDCGDWSPGDNLAAGAKVTCDYAVLLDGPVDGTNVVTVDAANADPVEASDGYDFPSEPTVVEGSAPASVDVVDERFEYRETVTQGGSTQFAEPVTCEGGTFTNTVQLVVPGEGGGVVDSATAQVVVPKVDCGGTPPPPTITQPSPQVDVQIVKDATAQVTLGANGTAQIVYSVVIKNNGPNMANDVTFADAAPSGVVFGAITKQPDFGSCSITPSLLQCSLGQMGYGVQTTITWTATVSQVGTVVNTGTVTSGEPDTNPGNNTDTAETVVVAPPVVQPPVAKPPVAKPPVAKPKPKPAAICLKLAVRGTKMVSQGKQSKVIFKVTRKGKPAARVAVVLRGAGIYRVVKTNKQGLAIAGVTPAKSGIVTATLSPKQVGCNSARVGVVGVFEPPVAG